MVHTAPEITPVFEFPEASKADVPLPSLKPYAAIRPSAGACATAIEERHDKRSASPTAITRRAIFWEDSLPDCQSMSSALFPKYCRWTFSEDPVHSMDYRSGAYRKSLQ